MENKIIYGTLFILISILILVLYITYSKLLSNVKNFKDTCNSVVEHLIPHTEEIRTIVEPRKNTTYSEVALCIRPAFTVIKKDYEIKMELNEILRDLFQTMKGFHWCLTYRIIVDGEIDANVEIGLSVQSITEAIVPSVKDGKVVHPIDNTVEVKLQTFGKDFEKTRNRLGLPKTTFQVPDDRNLEKYNVAKYLNNVSGKIQDELKKVIKEGNDILKIKNSYGFFKASDNAKGITIYPFSCEEFIIMLITKMNYTKNSENIQTELKDYKFSVELPRDANITEITSIENKDAIEYCNKVQSSIIKVIKGLPTMYFYGYRSENEDDGPKLFKLEIKGKSNKIVKIIQK